MKKPVISATEAAKLIKDGDTVAFSGFGGIGFPEELTKAIEEVFVKEGRPRDLTILFAAGQGDRKERGLNHLGHEGLLKRAVGGHWFPAPKVGALAVNNKIEGYCFPQGVVSQLYRAIAGGRPGLLTHVGLNTFLDPRYGGGKMNDVSTEDLIDLVTIRGREQLLYHTFPINVALIRGTTADEDGNVTMEREVLTLDSLSQAQAAKNSGGTVIVQAERLAAPGSFRPRDIIVPGILVDAIVLSHPENHWQTFEEYYNPSFSSEVKIPLSAVPPLPLNERKVIARRTAMEFVPNGIINLGVGMPAGAAAVAAEEGIDKLINMTLESGPIGGVPAPQYMNFGAAYNPDALITQNYMFDWYDGGAIDVTGLGIAQCDRKGNVNVSKFAGRVMGVGGFPNIAQNAKKTVFMGAFTAGGLELDIGDGRIRIIKEGRYKKFVSELEQKTYDAQYAIENGHQAYYITERAVFILGRDGIMLTEIAPGVDLQRDVLGQMEFVPIISKELKLMDPRIFREGPMNIKEEFCKKR